MIPESHLFLDIETLPTDDPDFIDEAEKSVKCPATYKKEESIKEWWENEGPKARKAAVHKTGLDGGIARMAAIAWGWGAGEIKAAHTALDGGHSVEQERRILEGFFAECQRIYDRTGAAPTIVGHCVTSFDIRWIWHRAIVLGVTPPWWWPVNVKPWDADAVQDTAVLWVGPRDRISLDRLARILGVGAKGEMDGSQVWDQWEAGEHERVREYCAADVRLVRAIWCRIVGEDAPAEDEVVEETAAVEAEVPGVAASEVRYPPVDVAENTSDEEIVDAVLGPLDKRIQDAPLRYLKAFEVPASVAPEPEVAPVVEKPVVQRPKVVPVFLRDVFPEEEAV